MADDQLSFLAPTGKRCSKCRTVKAKEEFHTLRGEAYGPCKECTTLYSKKRYAETAEEQKTSAREWRKANPDRVKANREKWEAANPEKVRISDRNRRRKRPEKSRENSLAWKKKNPAQNAANAMRYHTAKRDACPWWLNFGHHAEIDAYYLFTNIFKGHDVDHIMPIRSKVIGGLHVPWNLQVLTTIANHQKGNRIPDPATIAPYIERPTLVIDADGFASLEFSE